MSKTCVGHTLRGDQDIVSAHAWQRGERGRNYWRGWLQPLVDAPSRCPSSQARVAMSRAGGSSPSASYTSHCTGATANGSLLRNRPAVDTGTSRAPAVV